MLLTNDGRVTERLLSPRFAHEKEYVVTVQEKVAPRTLLALTRGIETPEGRLSAKRATATDRHTLTIVLTEGKKHQIRRMLSALRLTVTRLERRRIMGLSGDGLRPGASRPLRKEERDRFLASLGLPPRS
jgi:pseudouridine synthase